MNTISGHWPEFVLCVQSSLNSANPPSSRSQRDYGRAGRFRRLWRRACPPVGSEGPPPQKPRLTGVTIKPDYRKTKLFQRHDQSFINIFSVSNIKEMNSLSRKETEFNPIVLINPKTPHFFVVWFKLLGTKRWVEWVLPEELSFYVGFPSN